MSEEIGYAKKRGHFVLRRITLGILNKPLPNLAKKSLYSEHRYTIYLNQLWKIVAPSSE